MSNNKDLAESKLLIFKTVFGSIYCRRKGFLSVSID